MKRIKLNKTIFSFGALLAALTTTLCCIIPLILFLLGISGAWIANLTALEPYRPYFLSIAAIFIILGFWQTYKKPEVKDCKEGSFCAMPISDKLNKIMLFVATAIIILVAIYPYIAPYILAKL